MDSIESDQNPFAAVSIHTSRFQRVYDMALQNKPPQNPVLNPGARMRRKGHCPNRSRLTL